MASQKKIETHSCSKNLERLVSNFRLVQPIKTWESLGIAWADLSKDWLPSDLQPPSLHTVYICLLLIQVQK
jgi:hypothetical protein